MKTGLQWLITTTGAVLLFAAIGSSSFTEEPAKAGSTKAEDKQTKKNSFSSKPEKVPALPDFNAELELPFSTLESLGSRIRLARKDGDPVGLASSAKELSVAEKVSGKKASLTSDALVEEAVQLAQVRYNAKELEAVALLTGKKELNELAKKAAKAEADEIAAAKRGEKPRGIPNDAYCFNATNYWIKFRVNYGSWRYVAPGKRGMIPANQGNPNSYTYLEAAYSNRNQIRWTKKVYNSDVKVFGNYYWRVEP